MTRPTDETPWLMVFLAVAFAILVVAMSLIGCGTTANYAGVTTACVGAERAVTERSGSTYEEDTHDVAVIRAVCARVRAEVIDGGQ